MKIKRIVISLMIALCFLLPTSAVIADKDKDADALTDIVAPNVPMKEPEKEMTFERKSIVNDPLIEQATSTEVLGVYLGECDSNAMFPLLPARQLIPLDDCYEVWYKLQSVVAPSIYEPEVEIYKYDSEIEYCIYETSFEDNALNYMHWGQIDGDCIATGGYYDGWAWSDARACGSEHAFKNTMYDEYKNMQDDMIFFKGYLNEGIDLTAGMFDLCDGTVAEINPQYVKVEFDVYVDGEYKEYLNDDTGYFDIEPLDYLLGGLLDWDGNWVPITPDIVKDNWQTMFLVGNTDGTLIDNGNQIIIWNTNGGLFDQNGPGSFDWTKYTGCEPACPNEQGIEAEKIAACPGWWHVIYVLDVAQLPDQCAEHFRPAFRWISDKERVFEGAYIDNLKISLKQGIGEKVYQGHSQEWMIDETTDVHYWKFPLDWDCDTLEETFKCDNFNRDLDDSYYKMIVKIKADNASYQGPMPGYYVYYEVIFEVGTTYNFVVTSMDIEDDFYHSALVNGVLPYPSDAHVKFCIENSKTRVGCDEFGNPIDINLDNMPPAENIVVTASAYKLEKETVFFEDFEGMFGWSVVDDPTYSETLHYIPPYVTTDDSWSGSKSLAINSPVNNMIPPCSRMIAYSNKVIDMECVEEAYLDFYYKAVLPSTARVMWIFTGYTYLLGGGYIDGTGEDCQKTWLGPMQPQCVYKQINFLSAFVNRVNRGFFMDENGHPTYETQIGFYALYDAVTSDYLYPTGAGCFEDCDTPYSGVWIDDISVKVVKRTDKVWSESTTITGCSPGDICCDQFTWEDPDYCNYKVVVEVAGDCDIGYDVDKCTCTANTSDNWLDGKITVIEECEAWYKAENVDITECTPEAWCISNVVGNDCGNGGIGDQYALATNCDSNAMPSDVEDTIGFGCLDISHAWNWAPEEGDDDDDDYAEYCVEVVGDVENEANGYFSSEYYDQRLFESFDLGGTFNIDAFEFYGVIAWGDDSPEGLLFDIEFYADDGGDVGASLFQQDWTCGASNYVYYDSAWGYTVWLISGTLTSPAVVSNGWVSFYSIDPPMLEDLAWIDGQGQDGTCWIRNDGAWSQLPIDLAYCISTGVKADYKGFTYVSATPFDDGFEATPFDANWAINTGWLDSYYGDYSCEGVKWAYSWAAGDHLQSPPFMVGNSTDPAHPRFLLDFQHYVELATHPQTLYIGIDGTPIYQLSGATDETCQQYQIDFSSFVTADTMHTVDFWGMTSDFYGQILDDVLVTTWDEFWEEDVITTHPMYFNMTYQSDIKGDSAVYLDWAWVPITAEGTCEGCEDGCACPSGVTDWNTVEIPETNKECSTISVPLLYCEGIGLPALAVIPTNFTLCLRLRFHNWDYDWGIGFHVHEMSLSDVYDILAPENAVQGFKDAMWDFEDSAHFYTDIKVPLADECGFADPGMHRELGGVTLTRNCVSYGDHGKFMGEGDPALAGGEFAIYEDATWVTFPSTYQLKGSDSWGDGWTDYTYWTYIDLYVDGELVIDGFTVTGSANTVTFEAPEGSLVELFYYGDPQLYWCSEHSFRVIDPNGDTWCSYGTGHVCEDWYCSFTGVYAQPENEGRVNLWPAEPIEEAILWETEIEDSFEAYLFTGYWNYTLPVGSAIYLELSADGGDNWYIIATKNNLHGTGNMVGVNERVHISNLFGNALFDLTPWAGHALLIRLRVENPGAAEGYVSIRDLAIYCKQDNLPPSTTIALTGNLVGPGLYAGPVTATITAKDNHGMGEIHYILDGTEKVVQGSTATFKIESDGAHTIEYWGVDASGNEGAHGTVSFSIDLSPPTVAITAPEPGLYLFGRKLLSMSKPFIIGAFTAEATASDAQGVAVVKFLLNGETVGEDTTVPYSVYIAVKNMGAATLKVIAEDGVGNTAEDTLDLTYYKFL